MDSDRFLLESDEDDDEALARMRSSRMIRIRSKKALSTFSRVFADVSTNGTPQAFARESHDVGETCRRSCKSDLLPTRMNGIFSHAFTRVIWSLCAKRIEISYSKIFRVSVPSLWGYYVRQV